MTIALLINKQVRLLISRNPLLMEDVEEYRRNSFRLWSSKMLKVSTPSNPIKSIIMGRQKGVVRLSGKIGDLEFYEKDGKGHVRMSSYVSKARINTDPAFARTRENMAEFGGAVTSGGYIRECFAQIYRQFADRRFHNRLTGVLREVIAGNSGIRGRRPMDILQAIDVLIGLEFNDTSHLSGVLAVSRTSAVNTDRNEVVTTFPDFDATNFVYPPAGATHFALINAIGSMSKMEYNTQVNKYEPVVDTQTALGAVTHSAKFPIHGAIGGVFSLTATLPNAPVLDPQVALLVATGIEFYQEVDGQFYLLAQNNALRIDHVF